MRAPAKVGEGFRHQPVPKADKSLVGYGHCWVPSALSTLRLLRCQSSLDLLILSSLSPGFNPMWEETLVFTVHMPEIALVRFLVWDHDPIGRDFIGQRTLAFSSIMPGKEAGRGSVFASVPHPCSPGAPN